MQPDGAIGERPDSKAGLQIEPRAAPHARTRETKTRVSRASAAAIEPAADAGPAAFSVISVRLRNVMTMSVTRRVVLPNKSMRITPRKRAQRVPTIFGSEVFPSKILEQIGRDLTYADLVEHTEIYEVAGVAIRTLRLEMIIRSKEEANRDKDRATLPILRQTLRLRSGREE